MKMKVICIHPFEVEQLVRRKVVNGSSRCSFSVERGILKRGKGEGKKERNMSEIGI